MKKLLTVEKVLPQDVDQALLVGRVWLPGVGPVLVRVTREDVYDISALAATSSQLMELPDLVKRVRECAGVRIADTAAALANSNADEQDSSLPFFIAPNDLQATKASGVTFVASMLERVIEEQARGDAAKAETVRNAVVGVIGDNLSSIKPGSEDAAKLKEVLIKQGVWSQYLEVGIGPDAEIFTKAQPMSSVGVGAQIGIHPKSDWNNPEPEVVLVTNSRGETVGATLGNDVNLRDFEGRSALLLGKAKDNNASSAVGPLIRLFDDGFSIDDVRQCDLSMEVSGRDDGFVMLGSSSLSKISRDPLDLVAQTLNANHQYPDGFVLFLGTMFAPTQDRHGPGLGFTHVVGDVVSVSTQKLGTLVNRVNHCDQLAPWTYGVSALMKDLAKRGLL